ncbi:CaiB/BaiF CoA transferase family protein [Hyphomonas sp.]|jgi:crotonobetainyl-CoA:carnitine CoA-transferase CaiB-like acyl-CoA transferase|uniref:CaiB/BaiF CoA transferase family protein n=1 Tax=Hyphomonas sp. TaxID=87 RepID=UPI001D50C499|nr:CoA transferase [Hyphomonas sp.]
MNDQPKQLAGLKVVEFTHMVMGPAAGLILADLGADVVKVEPIGGDKTRRLRGSGAGYFSMYNRNKRSLAIDLKSPDGAEIALKLIDTADVFIENFRPGALDTLGFGYDTLSKRNPRLIYCSEKGFLSGPYENRTALDEVAQMMGGLAYMTGPPGQPLRAGASVIDVTGGMFGAIAVLAALHERTRTGKGAHVSASLFETTAFLVGQHMAQYAVTGIPAAPMPTRVSAWAVYDVFDVKDGEKVFVGVVSDGQWAAFCKAFDLVDWAGDRELAVNNNRVSKRDVIVPRLRELFASFTKQDLMARLETTGLPFAPITKPEELFDDPHLKAEGGLLDIVLPNGGTTALPALPVSINGVRPGLCLNPPRSGEHSREIISGLGLSDEAIDALEARGLIEEDASTLETSVEKA